MVLTRYLVTLLFLPILLIGTLQIDSDLPLGKQWLIAWTGQAIEFVDFQFYFASLPRAVLAMLVGFTLGLVGSLFQQITQNRLVSPMTLGASSGAWLALICASVWLPSLLAAHGEWIAMAGSILSVSLVLMIAGRQGLGGLPVVLSGMAVHILCGAVAAAVILLNEQYTRSLFIWGAGDLTQSGWNWVQWLWPKLIVGFLIIGLAPRPLMLLRLGQQGAMARGLNVWPMLIGLMLLALWLVAVSITAVGVIAFVSLLTPNIARSLGARHARDELFYSALLGSVLLLATDGLALLSSQWTTDIVPSGTAAAFIGAPALIWFARQRLSASDHTPLQLPKGASHLTPIIWVLVLFAALLITAVSLLLSPYHNPGMSEPIWQWGLPSEQVFAIRWPRMITALAAGAGMAAAGMVLQRLIRNPLASPDILGLSAGASLTLVLTAIIFGSSIHDIGSLIAFCGSMSVLAVLLLLGRKTQYAPGLMILVGISLAAFIEGVVHFALAKGNEDVYTIIGWLSGSTYFVSADQALGLLAGVSLLIVFGLMTSRWLTLISAGDSMALARGLSTSKARLMLLVLVALLCALVTSVMGPVAFVGLLAPHMAAMLGAKKARPQLILAVIIGAMLMLLSDWLGRTLMYPAQLPAGTIASILGGSYFIYLLTSKRRRAF